MTRIASMALILIAGVLAGCYATKNDAPADTSTSWLQHCTTQADCAAGSECIGGLCMPAPETAAEPNAAEPNAAQPSAAQPSAAQPSAGEPSATGTSAGEPGTGEPSAGDSGPASGAFIALDDIVLASAVAAVGWSGDRWLVAWSSSEGGVAAGYALELARVAASGEVERLERPYRIYRPTNVRLLLAGDGRLAAVRSNSGCGLDVFQPDLQAELFTLSTPCSGDGAAMAASPVPGSSDWLIAYGTGSYNEADQFEATLLAGRYRPDGATWSHEPLVIGMQADSYLSLSVFAAGDDAVVVWGNEERATMRSASALADPGADASAPPAWSDSLALGARTFHDGGYGVAPLGEQRMVFAMDGATLSAHVVGVDGAVTSHEVGSSTIADRRPGVAAAEELGLIGVCYARGPGPYIGGPLETDGAPDVQSDSMWFVMVNADGTLASEPVMFADGLADNTGCGVAWSGEHFLAVTWGILQEVVDNRYTLTRMRGQLFAPPGS